MKAKKLSKIKNGSQFTIPCTSGLYVKNGKVKGMDWIGSLTHKKMILLAREAYNLFFLSNIIRIFVVDIRRY